MSASLTSSSQNEFWEVGDQEWTRNLETGAFDLTDYRGMGAPSVAFSPIDLAKLVGARVSVDEADRGSRSVALYPGAFKFSPITGKALPEPSPADMDTWLPPFGGNDFAVDKTQGLQLTTKRLVLRQTLTMGSEPDRLLTMPPPGNYQFLVSAFDACESRLVAVDFSRGLIYHWAPHAETWLELHPGATETTLPGSYLGDASWGMVVTDSQGSTKVFMPTDGGLAIVGLHLVTQTYELRTVGQRCTGAPVMWQGKVHVPMQGEDGKLGVYTLDPDANTLRRVAGSGFKFAAAGWVRPVVDRQQIIWMASMGQLIVKRSGASAFEASIVPWPSGITPRFDLGSPYLSESGQLWQQCFRLNQDGTAFVFVEIGLSDPQIRSASSPVLSTGVACFQRGKRLGAAPWFDPEDDADSSDALTFPLLESTEASTVLCASVPGTYAVESVFASYETFTTTFELRGEHDVKFLASRMPRPWATKPFVYSGHLYLYHPDKRRLPGWRLEP
jgi:hypothetical protein